MHLVQYIAVAPGVLRSGRALFYLHKATLECIVDRSQLDPRILISFATTGTAILGQLTARLTPSPMPWGQIRLPRVERGSTLLVPEITPTGITVPIPSHLITEALARDLEDLGTNLMRYYEPPSR